MPNPIWDLTDQDCDAFDLNWNKREFGAATASLVTYDSRTCFKLIAPADGSVNYTYVTNTNLSDWTEGSFEVTFRTGPICLGGYPKLGLYVRDKDKYQCYMRFYWDEDWTSKPYFSMGAGTNNFQQWIDFSANTWHTIRLIVNSSHGLWGFIDGQYLGAIAFAGSPSSSFTANTMGLKLWGVLNPYTGTRETWIDHARASTTKLEPDYCGLINIQGDDINTRYYSEGNEGSLVNANPADPVRYALENRPSGTGIYAIPVVTTGDSLASKIRVETTGGTKALQLYPTSF